MQLVTTTVFSQFCFPLLHFSLPWVVLKYCQAFMGHSSGEGELRIHLGWVLWDILMAFIDNFRYTEFTYLVILV